MGSIRSAHNNQEREAAVNDFTDKDSKMSVFVLNAQTNVTGLNLHHHCHRGLVLQLFWNISTLVQAMGRIIRIGQTQPVHWHILRVKSSYYDVQEERMVKKFAETLRNEGFMPDYLSNSKYVDLQRVVAYEQIRVLLSQPFNRFGWSCPHLPAPTTIRDYHSDQTRRVGHFFTLLARHLLMLAPEQQDAETLDKLALNLAPIAQAFADEKRATLPPEWVTEQLLKIPHDTDDPKMDNESDEEEEEDSYQGSTLQAESSRANNMASNSNNMLMENSQSSNLSSELSSIHNEASSISEVNGMTDDDDQVSITVG